MSPLNLERAFRMMERYEVDALVATTFENNLYTSDFLSLSQSAFKSGVMFTVLPRYAEPAVVLPISDLDLYADSSSWIKDIRCYGTFYIEFSSSKTKSLLGSEKRLTKLLKDVKIEKTAVDALIKILQDRGLDEKNIGVDEAGITCIVWDELKNKLPAARIKHGAKIFKEIRMVKTAEEIKRLKKAAEISEKSLHNVLKTIKEGVSEADLAREFEANVVKEGGKPFVTVFGFGPRSAFPNAMPSDYRLKKGDIVRFDGGCIYKNYPSDIALSAVFGQPSEKHKKYYNAIVKGTLEAINNVKPNVKASDIFNIALETTRKSGIPHYRRHHCGHGIGIEAYDMPILGPTDITPLEEGMVINVETPYYEIGFGGLQIEETIVVTRDEYKYLTTPMEELLVL